MDSSHVGALSILCLLVSLLICFGVPIGLAIWSKAKYKKAFSFLPMLAGAGAFVVFQIIIRISILLPLVQTMAWFRNLPWLAAAFLCITAGLFEEPARFLMFSLMKKKRQFPDGLSYGIGHGGIEAIVLVGLTLLNYIIYCFMINAGTWEKMISALPAATSSQYAQLAQGLVSSSPWSFLVGGVERLFAITVQIALSFFVLKGFIVNRKWTYLALATLLHALVDFSAVGLQILKVNALIIEGVVGIEAVLALLFIVNQAKDWHRSHTPEEGVPNELEGQTSAP